MTNIAFQFLTYDKTRSVVRLLHSLEAFTSEAQKLRLVWFDLKAKRKTAALGKILSSVESSPVATAARSLPIQTPNADPDHGPTRVPMLNEGYVQLSPSNIHPELIKMGCKEVIAHLSVSPSSTIWLHSSTADMHREGSERRILRSVQTLEKCAAFRQPDEFPTVLEITLRCSQNLLEAVPRHAVALVERSWRRMGTLERCGDVDFGGEWLFFPKSGYNPNISALHEYYREGGRDGWESSRNRHNITVVSLVGASSAPAITVHSSEPRRPG